MWIRIVRGPFDARGPCASLVGYYLMPTLKLSLQAKIGCGLVIWLGYWTWLMLFLRILA